VADGVNGLSLTNIAIRFTVEAMTKERALTQLELLRATVSGRPGWVEARWKRADGSTGEATAHFRLKTAEWWYIARLLVDLPTTALLRDVPLARIEAGANADPAMRRWMESGMPEEAIKRARRVAAKRPRLERPTKRRPLPDEFFADVAAAYRAAVSAGLPPAKTLAEDSGTPQGTVNRWISTARDKDFLPKGTPGKVTV
jgi:hypothetical protein